MPTYVTLYNFTEQGLRTIKDSVKRAKAAKEAGSKLGIVVKEIVWTQGQYGLSSRSPKRRTRRRRPLSC